MHGPPRGQRAWRINGVEERITNAPIADICVLFTMENPEQKHREPTNAFIIELRTQLGVSVGKPEEKLGICGSPTASISFTDSIVPDAQRLSDVGGGFSVAMKTLDGGRIGIAAQAAGIAGAALADEPNMRRETDIRQANCGAPDNSELSS